MDHGTISPRFAKTMAETVAKTGGAFLDAPISGGPQGAKDGALRLCACFGLGGGGGQAFRFGQKVFFGVVCFIFYPNTNVARRLFTDSVDCQWIHLGQEYLSLPFCV